MEKLVLTRDDLRMPIKKLCEYISGGRNPDDALAFIDYNDNVRVAGLNTASRFGGASPECPAIMMCLPNQEKASKVYATSRTIYTIVYPSGHTFFTQWRKSSQGICHAVQPFYYIDFE